MNKMKTQRAKTTRAGFSAMALAAAALWIAPVAARAESSQAGKASSDFGIGVVTVLSNVGYMPVKVCYAVLGGVTGSLAYALTGGNRDVADGIWVPSMGGDYVLTTDMMSGDEEVRFSGLRKTAPSELAGAASEEGGSEASDEDEDEPSGSDTDTPGGSVF